MIVLKKVQRLGLHFSAGAHWYIQFHTMSASAEGGAATTKAVVHDPPESSDKNKNQQKAAAPLEEDDEFEDFPVEGMVVYIFVEHITT